MSTPEDKPASDAVDVAGKAAIVENEQLKVELTTVKAERDSLKKALAQATDTIEQQERAKLIPVILANTNMTKAEVQAMDVNSMFDLTETFRILKRGAFAASVRPGADAEEEQDARLTVPKKFKYGKEA